MNPINENCIQGVIQKPCEPFLDSPPFVDHFTTKGLFCNMRIWQHPQPTCCPRGLWMSPNNDASSSSWC